MKKIQKGDQVVLKTFYQLIDEGWIKDKYGLKKEGLIVLTHDMSRLLGTTVTVTRTTSTMFEITQLPGFYFDNNLAKHITNHYELTLLSIKEEIGLTD
jgi:hypothetical protein